MNGKIEKLFSEAYENQLQALEELSEPISLSNPYTKDIYTLTHKYKFSLGCYIGHNLDRINLHIKIFVCENYSQLKSAHQKVDKIYQSLDHKCLVQLFDNFEVYDNDLWYYICVTISLTGLSLYDFSEYLHGIIEYFEKDECIKLMLTLLDLLQLIQEPNKNSLPEIINPSSILVCKSTLGIPLVTTNSSNFSLVILPFSRNFVLNEPCRISSLLHHNSNHDIWGISLCIYGFAGCFPLNTLPVLKDLNFQHLCELTPLRGLQDPALEEIFRVFQKLNYGESVSHPYLNIWKGIYEKNWKIIDKCEINELSVLHSGLLFQDPFSRKLVIKKVLVLAKVCDEVHEYLMKHSIFEMFVEKSIKMNWNESPELLEPFYKILKKKTNDNSFKQRLVEMGIYGLILTMIEIDPYNKGFYEFVHDFVNNNTMTLLQIINDKGTTMKALKNAKKNFFDKDFVSDTMPFYGQESVKIIRIAYSLDIFPPFIIIRSLRSIPFFHKFENISEIVLLLINILKDKNNKDDFEVIKETIKFLSEVLCANRLTNYLNIFETHQKPHQNTEILQDLSIPLCRNVLLLHSTYNLTCISPYSSCNFCFEPTSHFLSDLHQYELKLSPLKFTFILSNGIVCLESKSNKFSSQNDIEIKTAEAFSIVQQVSDCNILVYYEVKINKAGKHENIIIGLKGTNICYHGINGCITNGNHCIGKAPRYGSFDLIGIGIKAPSKIFFTYNGMISNQDFEISLGKNEVKIFVVLTGECEVEIRMRGFLIQTTKLGEGVYVEENKKNFDVVFKVLIEFFRKKWEENFAIQKKKFMEILKNIGKDDLLKKLGK